MLSHRIRAFGFALLLPLLATATPAAFAADEAAATGAAGTGMLAQLPAFLSQLDAVRGKALTATETAGVTNILTTSNNAISGIQSKFINGVAASTGIDPAILSAAFPSATQEVSNSDLTSKLEDKLGKKLGFLQNAGITAANALRNNSLDGIKPTLVNGVASKAGVDPDTITSLLPLLGF